MKRNNIIDNKDLFAIKESNCDIIHSQGMIVNVEKLAPQISRQGRSARV